MVATAPTRGRGALLALVLLAVLPILPSRAEDEYEKALAAYEARIDRPPLATRLGGIRALARTRDPRALALLAARYAKPRVPKEHERHLIASTIGAHFTESRHLGRLAKLRRAHRKDEHAWLWFHAARGSALRGRAEELVEGIRDAKTKPFLRAALLERLAAEEKPEGLALVTELLGDAHPRKGMARTLLLESCASALLAHRDNAGGPTFARAARLVVDLLARDDLPERVHLTIARYLAKTFRVDKVTTDHAFWRRMLAASEPVTTDGETVAGRPRFFGLEASGTRLVYLIDLSDSMLDRLTKQEKFDARPLPGTPAAQAATIDWEGIESRFDLARAYLKQSLSALDADVHFMVIGFGDLAEPFRSTRRLVKASRGNVRAAIRELDDLEPGRVTPRRPYGTLKGATNVHGALLLAFRATSRKRVAAHEHVDETTFEDGCDTIFLFGDGQPTEDDFAASDRFDGGRMTTDTETGATREAPPGGARFYGPYRAVGNLLGDVRRMNLFRKAEIHTIAMGEANPRLMRGLAEIGLGHYRSIGLLGRGGRVNAWWILGPFPAPDIESWGRVEGPEEGVRLAEPVRIGERSVFWRRIYAAGRGGVLYLRGEFTPKDQVSAYACAEIHVEEAGPVHLEVGSDDGVRVWLNGALVHEKLVTRKLKVAEDEVEVRLQVGWNRILVKVCQDKGKWGFALALRDANGKPLRFRMR